MYVHNYNNKNNPLVVHMHEICQTFISTKKWRPAKWHHLDILLHTQIVKRGQRFFLYQHKKGHKNLLLAICIDQMIYVWNYWPGKSKTTTTNLESVCTLKTAPPPILKLQLFFQQNLPCAPTKNADEKENKICYRCRGLRTNIPCP